MAIIGEMKKLTIGGSTYTIPEYSLPIASASTLGGVKIGTGLTINSTTGVLSATGLDFDEADPVFTASAAYEITSSDITNWNSKTSNTGTVTSITLTQGTGISIGSSGTAITTNGTRTIALATITKNDTTSTASPSHGGTFTAIDSITYDTYGRVTGINTKTVTLPADSNTDTKVTQAYSTTNNSYPILFSATAGISSTNSRGATTAILNNAFYANPSTGNLQVTKLNNYTPAAAMAKAVDTSISSASTSNNLPTSAAVASFVEGKGYLTSSDLASVLKYKGTKASVANLPTTGNVTGDVWHITADGSEYAWDGSMWQELGTAIDLSGYALKSELPTDTNTWRTIQVNDSDILGSEINTGKLNLKAGTNVSITNSGGTVTISATDTNTDEKLKWTASTSSNTYYPLQSTSTATTSTANTLNSVSFYQYYNTAGGYRRFILGNATAYTSSSGAYGTIRLYGTGATYYGDLNPGTIGTNSLTANRTWTLPDKTGTIALTSDIPTVPTKTSQLTNDGNGTSAFATMDDIGSFGGGTVTSITLKAGSGITLDTDNTAITTTGTRTISHADTSSQSSSSNSGRTYIQSLTLDTYGHVTGISTATETVNNTDENVKQESLNATNSGRNFILTPSLQTTGTITNKVVYARYMTYNDYSQTLTLTNSSSSNKTMSVSSTNIVIKNGTYTTIFEATTPTTNRTITFPNKTGTVALTDDIPDVSGKIDTAGTGLSKSGTTLNHSNSVTAKSTQAVYPITFDAQGHITGSGTAVTIPTVPGIATNTTAGLVKPWYYWQQSSTGPTAGTVNSSATVNARSATAGRYYPIEIDKDGRMFVNVPWTNVNSDYITTDTNTTYTLSGALSSHKFTSTLTPSSGTPTTSDFTLAAGTGITITDTTSSRTMTIACSVTNTDTKVTQAYSTTSNSYPLLMTATSGTSSTSSRGDTTSILNNQIYANPSTGTITATAFSGAAAATTAYTTANLKNIVESTSDPDTASSYPTGTVWIKYTA